VRFLPFLILLWPLLEIAGFVVVGSEIGVLPTIGLTILTAVAGSILLRVQGFGVMRRIQAEMDAGRDPGRELANGAMILFAGVLLLLPGFVTDIVGLLLFLPPVRDFAWRLLKGRVAVWTFPGGDARAGRPGRSSNTIDLDPDEYSSQANPDTPWRRIDKER
jgi:UPF0716 protein FxsA